MNIVEKDTHEAKILVIENEESAEDFTRKMICHVKDPLFLPGAGPAAGTICQTGFGYDISRMQPLCEALKNRTLSAGDITAMLIRLGNAILVLEAHLLGDENLLLSPERIYVKPGSVDLSFCPAFPAEESFEERLRPLIQEIFLHADTRDPQTLALASELLKVALRKHYRMHDLMDVLQNGARPADGGNTEKEEIKSIEETGTVPHLLPKRDHGEAGAPLPSLYDPQFAEYPEMEKADKEEKGGLFGRIKAMASAVVSWVRGDDEIESTALVTFEDHT